MKKEDTLITIIVLVLIAGVIYFGVERGVLLGPEIFDFEEEPISEKQIIEPFCGNHICDPSESVEKCPDCFFVEEWGWPETHDQLDYIGQTDIYTTLHQEYVFRARESPLIPTTNIIRHLPGDIIFTDWMRIFINIYNPDFFTSYDPRQHFERFFRYYRGFYSNTKIGSYVSAFDCRGFSEADYETYPYEQLPCDWFEQNELMFRPYMISHGEYDRWRINILNPSAREKLKNYLISDVLDRRLELVYFDNVLHPSTGGWLDPENNWHNFGVEYNHVISFMQEVKTELNNHGIKVATNFAGFFPWNMIHDNYLELNMLATATDGLTLEGDQIFHWYYVREYPDRMLQNIQMHRRWLDADKLLLYIPAEGINEQNRRGLSALYASLAMAIYEPGDSIFVSRTYYTPDENYIWRNWPQYFGAPLSEMQFTQTGPKEWKVIREFENRKLYIEHKSTSVDNQVTFSLPDLSRNYVIIVEPGAGSVQPTGDGVNYIYSPNPAFSGNDVIIFRSDVYNGNKRDFAVFDIGVMPA